MLAFSAGAQAEPNPKASAGQSPSAADIKPGSLELDPNAPATDSGASSTDSGVKTPSTGLGSSRPDFSASPPAKNAAPKPPSAATAPSAPPKTDAAKAPSTGNGSQILVNIDKSTQEMTVFIDGIERHTWPVSTGTRGYTTPSGSYTASSMNEMWYSKQWDNAPMPHSVFFTKRGHAIHGTQEVKRLGKPASHGCVRLAPANAKTLFHLVKAAGLENTQIVLTGTTPGGEGPPAVASRTPPKQIKPPRGYNPWFEQPAPQYVEPRRPGLFGFGRRNRNAQGFNAPRQQPRYQQPRGLAPRGYGW